MSRIVYRAIKHASPRISLAVRAASLFLSSLALTSAQPVDYESEVKPLLRENCYQCHGASQQKHDLRLDTAASLLKGGKTGPGYVPGKSGESLIVQVLKGAHTEIPQMPYNEPPLDESEIALVARWIDQGAVAPADEEPESTVHWSFIPPARPELPTLPNKKVSHPIDRFIRAKLESKGVAPSPEADRVTLLRRVSLDLIGLPPTPEEVASFVNDQSPDAYEKAVNRLLASPHYGERWGRWWLDAARYGDSNGYSIDSPRQIWKYRDWVIDALNKDMPYDQFAIEQIAGDLLPDATIDQKIATGFNRNTQINQEGGIDPEQFRVEAVIDRVNTFSTVFLGLTVACAQCHDHKFDPISHSEYYQLYAFFNNTVEDGHGASRPGGMIEVPEELKIPVELQKKLEQAEMELASYLDDQSESVAEWQASLADEDRKKLKSNVAAVLEIPWNERTTEQKRLAYSAFKGEDPEFKSRVATLGKLEKQKPRPVTTLVMEELPTPRETHIFIKGDFTRPSDIVTPGVPAILHDLKADGEKLNRLDLAKWLVDPANPLMARVTVNRVWQQYFGKGLVETENDFGTQGILPTHPELLDWLASEFAKPELAQASPWSLKHIHRLIVTSDTYRQSSNLRKDLLELDANNKWLARQSRLRLDAEIVRDVALAASGLLTPKLGGPPVYPPQPDGVMSLGQVKRSWKASTGPDRYRRGLYTHLWRATPHPALAVFDAPDGFSTCTKRIRSNTPLQALTLLNDQQFFEFAEALGKRISTEPDPIEHGFRLCVGRAPSSLEKKRLQDYLEFERGPDSWTMLARVLLNLDETITRE